MAKNTAAQIADQMPPDYYAGVGKAATSAVVTAILFIIVADALFAVLFHAIGL